MRKIAILGKATRSRAQAPFSDRSWEIWGLGFDNLPRCDRRFELHNANVLEEVIEGAKVRDKLRAYRCPIYMQEAQEDIPNSRRYPLEEIVTDIGTDYFASTFGLMLGMAIHEKVDRIGIWGVDLNTTEEYSYQRPNAEFLIGVAIGRGIKVYIPPQTHLLTAPGRYGWHEDAYLAQIRQAYAERMAWAQREWMKDHWKNEAEAWRA